MNNSNRNYHSDDDPAPPGDLTLRPEECPPDREMEAADRRYDTVTIAGAHWDIVVAPDWYEGLYAGSCKRINCVAEGGSMAEAKEQLLGLIMSTCEQLWKTGRLAHVLSVYGDLKDGVYDDVAGYFRNTKAGGAAPRGVPSAKGARGQTRK